MSLSVASGDSCAVGHLLARNGSSSLTGTLPGRRLRCSNLNPFVLHFRAVEVLRVGRWLTLTDRLGRFDLDLLLFFGQHIQILVARSRAVLASIGQLYLLLLQGSAFIKKCLAARAAG